MDRRYFISQIGRVTAAGGAVLPLISCDSGRDRPRSEDDIEIPAALATALAHLADPDYRNYAVQSSQGDLYQALLEKGVVTTSGELVEQSVVAAAQADTVIEYGDFYHTQTELQLYSLAYSLVLNPPAASLA